jgi:hypothetical protein
MDRHLHHDNAVLQAKVNSLQRLVDQMTTTNHSLWMQLKHHKPRQNLQDKREKLLKPIHPSFTSLVMSGDSFLFAEGPANP